MIERQTILWICDNPPQMTSQPGRAEAHPVTSRRGQGTIGEEREPLSGVNRFADSRGRQGVGAGQGTSVATAAV